jgi:hypothetical protein
MDRLSRVLNFRSLGEAKNLGRPIEREHGKQEILLMGTEQD